MKTQYTVLSYTYYQTRRKSIVYIFDITERAKNNMPFGQLLCGRISQLLQPVHLILYYLTEFLNVICFITNIYLFAYMF